MNILRKLFATGKSDLPPLLPACYLYYSVNGISIAARHRTISGWTVPGRPMQLLRINASADEIGAAVLASLKGGREGLSEEEGNSETNSASEVSGERECNTLWKRWEVIHVFVEKNEVTVMPLRRYDTGAYGGRAGDPIYKCNTDGQILGRTIRIIVDGPRMPPLQSDDAEQPDDGSATEDLSGGDGILAIPEFKTGDRVANPFGEHGTVPLLTHWRSMVWARFASNLMTAAYFVSPLLPRGLFVSPDESMGPSGPFRKPF